MDLVSTLLWLDQRTLERRRLDVLWRLYRRLAGDFVRLTQHSVTRQVSTQEIPADEEAAARVAQHLSDTWFKGLNLEYHGIALGPLLRYKVGGYNAHLHGLCRHAYKAQALLETCSPRRVVMVEPALLPAGAFLEVLARRKGVQVGALLPGPLRRLGRMIVNRLFYTLGYEKAEVPLFQLHPRPLPEVTRFPVEVLFIASMNNYLNPMLPVMRPLKQGGKEILSIVPRAAKEWGNYQALRLVSGIVFAEELLDEELASEIAAKRRECRRLFQEKRAIIRERLRLENGLELWPFAAPGMRAVFEHLLPHAVGYIGLAERAFRRFRPRAIVIARQRRAFENAFVAVARRDGIPVVMLIHGHVSSQPLYHFIDGRFDQSDLICCWGEAQKRALIEKGALAERVLVTGNPQWDRLAPALGHLPPAEVCRKEIAKQLRIPARAFWVTFTSQAVSRSFFPAILDAVRRLPEAVLIVKVHPGERVDDYRTMIPTADRERCRVVKRIDLHTLLRASDVVLTYTSTTNLEALAVGTPLCIVDFAHDPDKPNRIDLRAYGIPEAQDGEALRQVLTRLRKDPAWKKEILTGSCRALEDYACGLDGKATKRVVEAVLELMQRRDSES